METAVIADSVPARKFFAVSIILWTIQKIHTTDPRLWSSLYAAVKCARRHNFELGTKFLIQIEMYLKKWIVQNHTTYDVILNPSNPHKVSKISTTKIINSKLEIDFENQM